MTIIKRQNFRASLKLNLQFTAKKPLDKQFYSNIRFSNLEAHIIYNLLQKSL